VNWSPFCRSADTYAWFTWLKADPSFKRISRTQRFGTRLLSTPQSRRVFLCQNRKSEAGTKSNLDAEEVEHRERQPVELSYHQHVACLDGDYFCSMIQTPFQSSAGGSA
jgi:hypothetical protein